MRELSAGLRMERDKDSGREALEDKEIGRFGQNNAWPAETKEN